MDLKLRTLIAGYYVSGISILMLMWYVSLWWWRKPRKQSWHDFWCKEIRIHDLVTRGESDKIRHVKFVRLLSTLLLGFIITGSIISVPALRPEATVLFFLPVGIAVPVVGYCRTYKKRPPFRVIPIVWGILIALTTTIIATNFSRAWNMDGSGLAKHFFGDNWSRTWFIGGIYGATVPILTFMHFATRKLNRFQWLAWCGMMMILGSTWVIVGLACAGFLK